MNITLLFILILIIIGVFGYFIPMLISANVTYSVWYDSSCGTVIDELIRNKKISERLFININQGKIWGFEQIIREKC